MKVLYIETSAILAWLFSEPNSHIAREQMDQSDLLVTSALSLLETERVLLRAASQNLLDSDEGGCYGIYSRRRLPVGLL